MICSKLLSLFILCPSCLLLAAGGLISCAPQAPQPPAGGVTLTIIGTGDLQGRLDAAPRSVSISEGTEKIEITGGISRLASLIKDTKQRSTGPVIVVSSGDDLMGSYFQKFNGKAIFAVMEAAGYELLALGNHEFDDGPGLLAEALDSVGFTALCSDLAVQGTVMEKSCQPYLLRDFQGVRVGFFSLMTEDFPVVTTTGQVTIKGSQQEVARDLVAQLKAQGAQVIVAVTHIGTSMDLRLAGDVEGIDIIFGGHSHDYPARLEQVNDTLVVNGGEKGAALVRLKVSLDGKNKVMPDSAAYTLIPVTADIKQDQGVEELLAGYRKHLPPAAIIGWTEKEWDLSKEALRTRESEVADMVTDIIRNRFKVDIVLYNGGSFRGNEKYPAGAVTSRMLSEIDEFETNVYLMTMQGKYIRQILEHSATLIGRGGFLQASGIQFTINPRARPQQLDAAGKGVRQAGERVRNIKIQSADGSWQPLDPARSYRLAANDFLVKIAGDRYFWFKEHGGNIRNTYSSMAAVLTEHFRSRKVVTPGKPDGRIRIK